MVDFVKVALRNGKHLLTNELLEFKLLVTTETGEADCCQVAEFKQLKIRVYDSGLTLITGSLHKFYDAEQKNYSMYSFIQLNETLDFLESTLNINLEFAIIQNIEFGVNLIMPFSPLSILETCLVHGNKMFESMHNGHYRQVQKGRSFIKFYDKGFQYNVKKNGVKVNILRFELKYKEIRLIKSIETNTLADLRSNHWHKGVLKLLISHWDKVYFFDFTTSLDPNCTKVLKWQNPNYWTTLDKIERYREKRAFRKYQIEKSSNNHEKIKNNITNTWLKLSNT